jgi:DnaK suppressor protein
MQIRNAAMPPSPPLHQRIREMLLARKEALRAQFGAGVLAEPDGAPDVHDFKDVAAEDWRLLVSDAARGHAVLELARISGALRRLDNGTYGVCEDCGEPIDERRLLALPPTALCADCQRVREAVRGFAG